MELIREIYREYRDKILEIRHHLHRFPELGDEEFATTEYLENTVRGLGLTVEKPLPTGLTAQLDGGDGPCVGVRADIDALPIREQCELPFRSERDGIMHACGHDVHMAATLGAAMLLTHPALRERAGGKVKFIFQPAEETDGGAARMIRAGALKSPEVDTVVGFHCEPDLPAGQIAVKYGYARASSDMFDIIVRGKSSHGAYPENGVDTIVAASNIVLSLQTLVSRNISAYEPCVITIGKFHAGTAENVVCDEAVLTGTMRTASPEVRDTALRRMKTVAEQVAAAYGAIAEVRLRPGYIALYNDEKATGLLQKTAEEHLGKSNVQVFERAMMSVDDFSFFAKEKPSVYFFAGTGFEGRTNYGLHHGAFEVNEAVFDAVVPILTDYILRSLFHFH